MKICRILGAFIVLFPQYLCSLLNLIFQGSLTRFRDLEEEKFASTRLAEIGVRELLLKPPSGSGELCTQGFLDSLILIAILRSKSKTTLEGCETGSYCSIAPLQVSLALYRYREDRDHSAASLSVYIEP